MKIGQRLIEPSQPPYIIAELGVNHDGSLETARSLVESAHGAGADAVKLQWFETGRLLSRPARLAGYQESAGAGDPFEMLIPLELDRGQMETLVDRAHDLGMHAIVTLFNVELVEAADALDFDAYKTASPDIVNRPLIEALLESERPLLVSTGAATTDEIEAVSTWLGDHPHVLMQCVSAYPTPDRCAALAGRIAMARINPRALGYSDHTTAIDTGGLAVASGACVIEKHLTDDRAATGPDHAMSIEPDTFRQYVLWAHRAHQMMGPTEKRVLDLERDVRDASRQSLTTRQSMPAGHVIAREELTIKRPGLGIAPWKLAETVGRRLVRAVEADMPLREEDLA